MAARHLFVLFFLEKLALPILMILNLILENALAHSRKWLAIFDMF